MATLLPAGVQTAADLDVAERQVYDLGGCRISRVDLQDVGLVGCAFAQKPNLLQGLQLNH